MFTAIVVGKTNTPIFGSTAYCKNLAYGTTRNPWNLDKVPQTTDISLAFFH